ncbi:hypothetical protein D9757_008820 [Collybiopsis confluens]|uniref:Uncharacterized protein n=1 Tax=Collybiopsis confluens TaxID=2823264 RepID=A0A8H5M0C2_9AGAR|nr:hypothetical protein D9757_008820 [Collybiopsis confluens]
MLIREKLKFEHIDIEFDETDMRYQLIYILTKSFHLIDPPTPAIFMAFLYLCRVFPDGIPYSGDPDVECATALHRLFLFCLRLVLQWCEDDALHYDFRGRFFLWHEHIGLEKPVFRTAEVNLMYLLDHNLCISNVVYARWMSDLRALLPAFLAGNYYQEERSAIEDLIECAFPPLTPEFLDPGTLPCNGYPLDEDWQPQTRTLHEFRQRGRDLIDSLTFGVAIPLYQALDAPFIEGEGDFEDHESFLDPFHSSKVLGSPSDDLYTHSETSGSESSSDDLYTHSETSGSDSSPCGRLLMDSSSPAESETDSLEETLQYLSNLEAKQLQPQIPPFPFPASLLSIAPPEWIESSLRLLGLC